MDNTYQPPGADPQDRQPTEQFWPMNSPAAGHEGSYGPGYGPGPGYRPAAGHSYQAQEPPGVRQHLARDRRKALHWTVGITVAAILAGAGLIAGEAWAGSPGSGAEPCADPAPSAGGRPAAPAPGSCGRPRGGSQDPDRSRGHRSPRARRPASSWARTARWAGGLAGRPPGAGTCCPCSEPAGLAWDIGWRSLGYP